MFAAFVVYRLVYGWIIFDAMHVPEFDFFCFRSVAESFSRFQLPDCFKWAPGYPLLMALWPFRFGGADRLLQGGEVVSLAAAVGTLLLLYRWARRAVGPAAVLAVVIAGSFKIFVEHAAQPLCDMTLVFFVVAAVATAGTGKLWPYAAAGAAALTRYEGIALIALVLLADVRRWRTRPAVFGYAAASAAPVAAWLVLSAVNSRVVNPYVEQMLTLQPVGGEFLRTLGYAIFPAWAPHLNFLVIVFGAVAAFGAVVLAARGGVGARVYVAFAAVYIAVHMLFPFSFDKYVLPLVPLVAVALVAGAKQILIWGGRILPRAPAVGYVGLALTALWVAAVGVSFAGRRQEPALFVWGAGLPLAALALAATGASFFPRFKLGGENLRRWAGVVLPVVFVSLFVNAHVKLWAANWYNFQWRRASLRAAGEALAEIVEPHETVCTVWPDIVAFYARPAAFKTVLPAALGASHRAAFPAAAARRDVAYLCYDSISGNDPFTYFAQSTGVPLMTPFAVGEPVPPYEYFETVVTPGEYVHFYRLGGGAAATP